MRMMPLVPAGLRIPGLRYCWSCESANRRSAGDNHDRQQQGGVSGPYQAQPLVVEDAWADQLCLIPVFLGSESIRFGHFRSIGWLHQSARWTPFEGTFSSHFLAGTNGQLDEGVQRGFKPTLCQLSRHLLRGRRPIYKGRLPCLAHAKCLFIAH